MLVVAEGENDFCPMQYTGTNPMKLDETQGQAARVVRTREGGGRHVQTAFPFV